MQRVRLAVQSHQPAGLAADAGGLVHDAARRADDLVFHTLARVGEAHGVDGEWGLGLRAWGLGRRAPGGVFPKP